MNNNFFYVILNREYGGFHVPDEVCVAIGCDRYPTYEMEVRVNDYFIDWVRRHPESPLKVARVPMEATDFQFLEYDGFESIIMCVDGKLVYADVEDEDND